MDIIQNLARVCKLHPDGVTCHDINILDIMHGDEPFVIATTHTIRTHMIYTTFGEVKLPSLDSLDAKYNTKRHEEEEGQQRYEDVNPKGFTGHSTLTADPPAENDLTTIVHISRSLLNAWVAPLALGSRRVTSTSLALRRCGATLGLRLGVGG